MRKHWAGIAFYVSLLLLVIAMGWYSGYSQQVNNRKWCQILVSIDRSPLQSQQFHTLIHNLANEFGCY